ncbi:MAG: hypothetical protein ACREDY_14955, partial [Bradyrhizobium sp.]
FLTVLKQKKLVKQPNVAALLPRVVERLAGRRSADPQAIADLLDYLVASPDRDPVVAGQCLAMLASKVQTREITGERLKGLRSALEPSVSRLLSGSPSSPGYFDAALLAATWQDKLASAALRRVFLSPKEPDERRLQAVRALVAADDPQLLGEVARALADRGNSIEFRRRTLDALGRTDSQAVAALVVKVYPDMEPELKPEAIELLTGRASWSKELLKAIADKRVAADALNLNQVRKLLAAKDAELVEEVRRTWGTLRTERNPQREQVIAQMRELLKRTPGDPHRGRDVFKKVCGQCHKIYGEGQEVGPDITVNGRGSFDQLLSNVFDPSLVIGAAYQAQTVI